MGAIYDAYGDGANLSHWRSNLGVSSSTPIIAKSIALYKSQYRGLADMHGLWWVWRRLTKPH
jgi:hypothetical protein